MPDITAIFLKLLFIAISSAFCKSIKKGCTHLMHEHENLNTEINNNCTNLPTNTKDLINTAINYNSETTVTKKNLKILFLNGNISGKKFFKNLEEKNWLFVFKKSKYILDTLPLRLYLTP